MADLCGLSVEELAEKVRASFPRWFWQDERGTKPESLAALAELVRRLESDEAALAAETQRADQAEKIVEKRGKEIDRQLRRAERAEAERETYKAALEQIADTRRHREHPPDLRCGFEIARDALSTHKETP